MLLISRPDKEQEEFERHNSQVVLSRIRLISLATVCLGIFWAYMDWIIIKNGVNRAYGQTLIAGHIISVAASAMILIFYKRLVDMSGNHNYPILYFILKLYVFFYILVGAVSSINSQRYTGNIYSYIILSLIVATALALKPSYMLLAFGVNHLIFLSGIALLNDDIDLFLVKFINATVLIIAAFLLGFVFYRHRMVEFLFRKELTENEENFKKLFYVNPYPVFITRMEDGKVIEANKRACSLLEIDSEGLHSIHGIDCFIKNDSILALQEELLEHSSTYNRIVEYDFNGKHMWVTANYELIDYHGEKCILTGIMDITEIRKAEEELNHYASTDTLTGILNRRMGLKRLEELIADSREDYLEFVLCFLDINNLKHINDTYGHGEGDRYILTFCNIIKKSIKEEDIFFRMGGDEFIIIFKDMNKSQSEKVWSEIVKQFNECNSKEELPYTIMASHGLAHYHSGMDIDLDYIIEKADKQMYKEKQKFRNSIRR
ncbi:MAG: diguanylate cyclase/phosphodiesterase with sensor [Herbinix sp.]|nr:diguanylate cyclase/phosphodiesterase with sensor [Herbinix sp.]